MFLSKKLRQQRLWIVGTTKDKHEPAFLLLYLYTKKHDFILLVHFWAFSSYTTAQEEEQHVLI